MNWTIDETHIAAALAATATLPATPVETVQLPSGRTLMVKCEHRQVTGSFKVRGALTAVACVAGSRVVAASAGNHGLGIAYASRLLGKKARVFVPESAARKKVDGILQLGAEVVIVPGHYDDAEREARVFAAESGGVFVSPFDDPWVAAGNGASLALELQAQTAFDRIVVPVGGGGLLAGLASALPTHRLVGVNIDACPAMIDSIARGDAILEYAPRHETLAGGLEGGVAQSTLRYAMKANVSMELVSEEELLSALTFAHREWQLPLEPSAAAALAFVLREDRNPKSDGAGTVLVSTGGNYDADVLAMAMR